MQETFMAKRGSTIEQLRRDIDSGRTGSKVDFPDPAAAPLGTDYEAAGNPPSPAEVNIARQHEVEDAPISTDPQGLGTGAYIYAGVLAIIIAALIAIAIWLRIS
jgi:hypothetical protein